MGLPELKILPVSDQCLGCQSDKNLTSRYVGVARPRPSGESSFEFWPVPLCPSCRKDRLAAYLKNQVKQWAGFSAACIGGYLFSRFAASVGPSRPPAGFVYTPQGAAFHGFIDAGGMVIGFVGAMALPLCLMYLARAFFMQRRFQRTQAIENNAIDAVHLEASKSQGGTALGAGETPEDAIPVSWAKSFLDQYPDKASLVFAACDRRLRAQTLYFPYFLYLSGILYIVTNALDLEPRGGWLGVAAFFGVIAGVSVAVIIWAESGFQDFWKLFRTTIFKSVAVWRFGLTAALGLLLIVGSIPAYFHGIKTHPNLIYRSYDKFVDIGVTFEYPREWRRKPFILEIRKSDVTINICPDHTLPKSDDALYAQLTADMKKREVDHTVTTWKVEPLTLANGYGFLVEDLNQNLRTLTAYVRDTDKACWVMLRMAGNDINASHEQAFMKILHNLQFVHEPQK